MLKRTVLFGMLVALVISVMPNASIQAQSSEELRVLELVNQERAQRGLFAYKWDSCLAAAAEKHSQDMATNNFFSHTGSDNSDARSRARAEGYPGGYWIGENIGAGYRTPEAVVAGWMDSDGHRRAILDGYNQGHKYAAVGLVINPSWESDYNYYWTINFGHVPCHNKITSISPSNGAKDVSPTATINISMAEAAGVAGDPQISFVCQPGNQTIDFEVASATQTSFVLDPTGDLPSAATCTFSFKTSAIQRNDGATLLDNDGTSDGRYTLTFETCCVPPEIVETSPTNNADDVKVDAAISLTMSEFPLTANEFPSFTCDGNEQPYSVSGNPNKAKTYLLTPNAPLPFSADCTFAIDTSTITDNTATALVDNDGDNETGTYNLHFTTEDAPAVIGTIPQEGETDVSVQTDLTLTTNERLFGTGNGTIILNCGSDDITFGLEVPNETTYVLVPDFALDENATCTLTLPTSAAVDADGNNLASNDGDNFVLTFTTGFGEEPPAPESAAPMVEGAEAVVPMIETAD